MARNWADSETRELLRRSAGQSYVFVDYLFVQALTAVTMILGLITTSETVVSSPPISTAAISREQERDVNDLCRQIAECQLGLLCLK